MPKKRRVFKPSVAASEEGGTTEEAVRSDGKIPRGWQLTKRVKEDHGQELFGLSINLYDPRPDRRNLFATAGANRATVYELEDDGGIQLKQVYVDADRNESFFACAWSIEAGSGDCLLAIAGQQGMIRILNLNHFKLTRSLVGHGNAINDLRSMTTSDPQALQKNLNPPNPPTFDDPAPQTLKPRPHAPGSTRTSPRSFSLHPRTSPYGYGILTLACASPSSAGIAVIAGRSCQSTFTWTGSGSCLRAWTMPPRSGRSSR
jgi:hypothetical protein